MHESPKVSTQGHILERRSERSSGWVRAAGSMCGLPRLVEDRGNGLLGLDACTFEKRQAGKQSHWGQVSLSRSFQLSLEKLLPARNSRRESRYSSSVTAKVRWSSIPSCALRVLVVFLDSPQRHRVATSRATADVGRVRLAWPQILPSRRFGR